MANVKTPEKNEKLAEFVGILLGDGNIYVGKKSVFQITVSGNLKDETDYILNFVRGIIVDIYGVEPEIRIYEKMNEVNLRVNSKAVAENLFSLGLVAGNKIKNNVGIPDWIKSDKKLLRSCVRGLIDTDGSIFRMSKRDSKYVRIGFKNNCKAILNDLRESFIVLGFHPSKIIGNNSIFISRQDEIKLFLKDIKFHNNKHLERLMKIAPSSRLALAEENGQETVNTALV